MNFYKQSIKVSLRFFGDLNLFIAHHRRYTEFKYTANAKVSVKDLIESVGVPHTEVGKIKVNGQSIDFNYLVKDKDLLAVFPLVDGSNLIRKSKLRPEPLREIQFVMDVHLGKLAKYLRLLGFDVVYNNKRSDPELALISQQQQRLLLSRDRGLLKRRIVEYGRFVRNTDVNLQLIEILCWLDIKDLIQPFSRCISCNGLLVCVDKSQIENKLLPHTKKIFTEFKQCRDCARIYWKGTHYSKMLKVVSNVMSRQCDKQ